MAREDLEDDDFEEDLDLGGFGEEEGEDLETEMVREMVRAMSPDLDLEGWGWESDAVREDAEEEWEAADRGEEEGEEEREREEGTEGRAEKEAEKPIGEAEEGEKPIGEAEDAKKDGSRGSSADKNGEEVERDPPPNTPKEEEKVESPARMERVTEDSSEDEGEEYWPSLLLSSS